MSDTIARELERLDKRIMALQAERRVLLKLQRANGGATRRKRAAAQHEVGAPRKRADQLRAGSLRAALVDCAKAAGKVGVTSADAFDAVSGQFATTRNSVQSTFTLLSQKGLVRWDDSRWVVA